MFLLLCDAPDRQSLIWWTLVFGVGMDAPSRYSASIASVNSSFLRRSGVRNADANALSTKFLLRGAVQVPKTGQSGGFTPPLSARATDRPRLTVGRCVTAWWP